MIFAADIETTTKTIEELSMAEKQVRISELLHKGDQYRDIKNYDLAAQMYEQVFVLDPKNRNASKRLDALKRFMMDEGDHETSVVGEAYQAEMKARSRVYWDEVGRLIQEKRWGRARFTLEKILLLDPLNEDARLLHEELKAAAKAGVTPMAATESAAK